MPPSLIIGKLAAEGLDLLKLQTAYTAGGKNGLDLLLAESVNNKAPITNRQKSLHEICEAVRQTLSEKENEVREPLQRISIWFRRAGFYFEVHLILVGIMCSKLISAYFGKAVLLPTALKDKFLDRDAYLKSIYLVCLCNLET